MSGDGTRPKGAAVHLKTALAAVSALEASIEALDPHANALDGVQRSAICKDLLTACGGYTKELEWRLGSKAAETQEEKLHGGGRGFGETDQLVRKSSARKDDDPDFVNENNSWIWGTKCFMMLLVYIFIFSLILNALERDNPTGSWSLIDSWYFAILTLGTVGYGVLIPSNDWTRLTVCVYVVMGLTFNLYVLGILCDIMLARSERQIRKVSAYLIITTD